MAGLTALAVAMGIGRFAFTPILPMMQEDAGVSITAGAWLASANYLGYLLGALSVMAVPIRAASAIRGGLVTIGLATLGMGLQDHFAIWIILRALAGIASAWVLICTSAWCLERLEPLRQPVLESTVFSGVGAGIALAGGSCLAFMHLHTTSARAWIVFGVASLALSVAIWPVFGAGDRAPSTARRLPRRAFAWDREWIGLTLCYGAFGFGYIIPATFLPVMARQAIRNPEIFGLSWPMFGAAAMASTLLIGIVRRLVTNRRVWIASHLVMALGVALPVIWPGIAATMLAALCVGGTFMVITMVGMQEARDVAGGRATGLMAAMTSAFALGQIAGPISASYLHGAGGDFSAALLVACGALVVSACVLGSLSRPGHFGVS
ncbi:MAG TPA: YbfB/YjiJ family MFS transporter [Patescibacteria group bacterium]|nr:YbfB/YjiJ family MFS transporter [Patescibacteria group bacterium]